MKDVYGTEFVKGMRFREYPSFGLEPCKCNNCYYEGRITKIYQKGAYTYYEFDLLENHVKCSQWKYLKARIKKGCFTQETNLSGFYIMGRDNALQKLKERLIYK